MSRRERRAERGWPQQAGFARARRRRRRRRKAPHGRNAPGSGKGEPRPQGNCNGAGRGLLGRPAISGRPGMLLNFVHFSTEFHRQSSAVKPKRLQAGRLPSLPRSAWTRPAVNRLGEGGCPPRRPARGAASRARPKKRGGAPRRAAGKQDPRPWAGGPAEPEASRLRQGSGTVPATRRPKSPPAPGRLSCGSRNGKGRRTAAPPAAAKQPRKIVNMEFMGIKSGITGALDFRPAASKMRKN
jgi:hypothetical protein